MSMLSKTMNKIFLYYINLETMSIANIKNLCTPAYVYLVVSSIFFMFMYLQNRQNVDVFCLGEYECIVPNTTFVFIIKAIYILFWTWILNLMCKAGASNGAWFLVLLPIILLFVLLALLFIQ